MSKHTHTPACPMCDSRDIEVRHDKSVQYKYLRKTHELIGQEYTECKACDFTFYQPGQIERNNERFAEFEKTIIKDISPRDILQIRQKYRLSQDDAAAIFNSGKNMFSKWERGDSAPTGTAARLLQLALTDRSTVEKLAALANVRLAPDATTRPHEAPTVRYVVTSPDTTGVTVAMGTYHVSTLPAVTGVKLEKNRIRKSDVPQAYFGACEQ